MFQSRDLSLMAMLIAFNIAIGGLVHIIKLPIYLDAIGTVVAVLLLGRLPAIIVGVLSFVIAAALISPVYIWFIGTQAVLALTVYWLANRFAVFTSLLRLVPAGIFLGIVTGIVSAPVIVFLFGGVAGSGRDLVTAALLSTGERIVSAVVLSGAASEPFDKVLQLVIAYFVIRALPKRVLAPFANPVLEKNRLL
jgi:energy-coupling factor transport system substrate-specific component